jgi:arylsulfatase A-like enzyme
MSGRYPIHNGINAWIQNTFRYGLPLKFATIADNLASAGYVPHAVGKWHLGFYKWEHTPTFRGFNSFLGYYSGGEDYFKHTTAQGYDLRYDATPKCGKGCSEVLIANGNYSTHMYTTRAIDVINAHDITKPLFLYLAYQGVHEPAQVPQQYVDMYNTTIQDMTRRIFAGMLTCVDEGITNVTMALKQKGMWENTLFIFTSDNGGPVDPKIIDAIGANNWPLRGGKHAIYEGGTRATAFIYGSMLSKTGYTNSNLMHGVDWLPTLMHVAGKDVNDTTLDGINQWNSLSQNGSAVRDTIYYGFNDPLQNTAIRVDNWKLHFADGGIPNNWVPLPTLHDQKQEETVKQTDYQEQKQSQAACQIIPSIRYPGFDIRVENNITNPDDCCSLCMAEPACAGWTLNNVTCNLKSRLKTLWNDFYEPTYSGSGHSSLPPLYMLFDVIKDPTEHNDVAAANPDVTSKLYQLLYEAQKNGVQAQNDPNCGPPNFPYDPRVGDVVLTPWC